MKSLSMKASTVPQRVSRSFLLLPSVEKLVVATAAVAQSVGGERLILKAATVTCECPQACCCHCACPKAREGKEREREGCHCPPSEIKSLLLPPSPVQVQKPVVGTAVAAKSVRVNS